ncbi:MAG: hypothetical protein Q8T13_08870 [Acidobacteriota bacterium]|nr:hypothetical protein [Acidobacteriota bacterium]
MYATRGAYGHDELLIVKMGTLAWDRDSRRRLCLGVMVGLMCVVGIAAARVHRASVLSASINEGISSEIRLDNALELTRRVAARFRHIEEYGAVGEVAAWPLRSEADYLLTGGDCGRAAGALGAVFVSRGRPFRILQANVDEQGAGHIMFETPDDAGRWVLLDPIEGRGFQSPIDGRFLGIDEIRALPLHMRDWLPEEYRDGELSLFSPYRRTNWTRLGALASVVRATAGDEWMRQTSMRVVILKSDHLLLTGGSLAIFLLVFARAISTPGSAVNPRKTAPR